MKTEKYQTCINSGVNDTYYYDSMNGSRDLENTNGGFKREFSLEWS